MNNEIYLEEIDHFNVNEGVQRILITKQVKRLVMIAAAIPKNFPINIPKCFELTFIKHLVNFTFCRRYH